VRQRKEIQNIIHCTVMPQVQMTAD